MKHFIFKTAYYLAILFVVVFAYFFYYVNSHPALPFFTNSVCFNAKAKFISTHQQLLEDSKMVIIGSSMDLYTMDGLQIRDSFHVPVINLASWGMKFSDFEKYDIWKKNKNILINLHFSDFGISPIYKYSGYPYSPSRIKNYINIFFNFATYQSHISNYINYTRAYSVDEYNSLKFDSTGSVIIPDEPIKIDSPRWNSVLKNCTKQQMNDLVANITEQAKKVNQIIISFSPSRPAQYAPEKSRSVVELGNSLKSIPNLIFLNNYDMPVTNNDFIDNCHRSGSGARRYTRKVITEIKSSGKLILP